MEKILLVEDDPFISDIYQTQFKKKGYNIDLAKDGEMALKKIQNNPPDLVLLDIILPKMDGWEVLEKLRSDPKTENIKVIVMSNLSEEKHKHNVDNLKVLKHFVKIETSPEDVINFIEENIK